MANIATSVSYSFTVRLRIDNRFGMLARVLQTVARAKGDPGALDVVRAEREYKVRDFTVSARDDEHAKIILAALKKLKGIKILQVSDRVFLLHLGGKIRVQNKVALNTRDTLSMAYTPGVARVCLAIAEDKRKVNTLTIKHNSVAVVSDGTAVLGLGDIGPEAAMPVMEGKAMLFKEFGGVDAFPICLATKDTEEIIRTVKNIAPAFGGINLEDISAPRCFEIEERLKKELAIPVFHDDQHGTAVVVLAALINALKIVHKNMEDLKIVVTGVGAAGVACSKILMAAGAKNVIGFDRTGAIYKGRSESMNSMKQWFAAHTNPSGFSGPLHEAMRGADLFLGVSGPGTIKAEDLKLRNKDGIVFAMANPTPEIMPDEAAPYVRIVATGRSDYPNQINNVLCFPGVFRGALDVRAPTITEEMKMAAARAIAAIVDESELRDDYIIPSVFNRDVAPAVAAAVANEARADGTARAGLEVGFAPGDTMTPSSSA